MHQFDKIIFVDEDDTARGVMATAIMRETELLFEPQIFSRGLVVLFPEPVNQKAEAVLARNGLTAGDHKAEALVREDADGRALLLVMEEAQLEKTREICPQAAEIALISSYAGFSGDIAALFGEDLPEYGKRFALLQQLIGIIADKFNQDTTDDTEGKGQATEYE